MCGIAGEVVLGGGTADRAAVARMTSRMTDRGPDGAGEWTAGWVALGHRRLKVIDLSDAGAQPMVDERSGCVLVFNGCIYNHAELRAELGAERFHSTSDTEVILRGYERWGEDVVDHLVGMFAFALVDPHRDRVVLARDRLGIKPLYLAESAGRLRFASTLPALLGAGGVDTRLDAVALHHYLSWHSIVPGDRTLIAGVRKLPPATVLVVERTGRRRERRYWRPSYERNPERAGWSRDDWVEAIHDALGRAVRRRLVADVPVGVLLSGGVDSSILVALIAEGGHGALQTFSVGFDSVGGEQGDEFEYSDAVAGAFGTRHHRIRVGQEQLEAAVSRSIDAMSEPMATHDVAAFFEISAAVAQEVKVVQSGQGADEIFAGYGYHQPAARAPRDAAAAVFRDAFTDHSHARLQEMIEPGRLPAEDVSAQLLEADLATEGAETALDAVLRLDTHTLMPDDPVKRVDNMTMAWGVEARVPFLDHDLVELAASCPPELKAESGGKGVLKELGRRLLPHRVIDRKKGYFPVPGVRNLEGGVFALARDALTAPEARARNLFRRDYIEGLLADPRRRWSTGGANVLWNAAVLELWLQRHGIRT